MFSDYFTVHETEYMKSASSEDECYTRFFVHWSLKEAYSKALGVGISKDLSLVHFRIMETSISASGVAVVYVHGVRQQDWRFDYFALDSAYVMAIARLRPPSSTVQLPVELSEEQATALDCLISDESRLAWDPLPRVSLKSMDDLVLKPAETLCGDWCSCTIA
jgi:phosphopantetheinyl transferase (holo-ACP synthase)